MDIAVDSADATNLMQIAKTLDKIQKIDEQLDLSSFGEGIASIKWDEVLRGSGFEDIQEDLKQVKANFDSFMEKITTIQEAIQGGEQLDNLIQGLSEGMQEYVDDIKEAITGTIIDIISDIKDVDEKLDTVKEDIETKLSNESQRVIDELNISNSLEALQDAVNNIEPQIDITDELNKINDAIDETLSQEREQREQTIQVNLKSIEEKIEKALVGIEKEIGDIDIFPEVSEESITDAMTKVADLAEGFNATAADLSTTIGNVVDDLNRIKDDYDRALRAFLREDRKSVAEAVKQEWDALNEAEGLPGLEAINDKIDKFQNNVELKVGEIVDAMGELKESNEGEFDKLLQAIKDIEIKAQEAGGGNNNSERITSKDIERPFHG